MIKLRIYIGTRTVLIFGIKLLADPAIFQLDLSVMHFLSFSSSFSFWKCQNYFKDGWNIFDCVTVLGSITDILVTELGVSKKHRDRRQKCKYVNMIYYQWLRGH